MERERVACAARIRDIQLLADQEASKWVDEMAEVRNRDAAMLRAELDEWMGKATALQGELHKSSADFDARLQQRAAEGTRALRAQCESLEAALKREREELREAKAKVDAKNNDEAMKILSRTWSL